MTKFPVIASLGPLIALVLACVFFAAPSDRFLSLQNVALILQQVMGVGTTAIGQTLVILTAGNPALRRSVHAGRHHHDQAGGQVGLEFLPRHCLRHCGVHGVWSCQRLADDAQQAAAFIVSLGMMKIAFAMTQLNSGAQTVTGLPPANAFFWQRVSAGVGGHQSRHGIHVHGDGHDVLILFEIQPSRHFHAVGSAPEATRLIGISTDKVLLGVCVAAGFFRVWQRVCRSRAPAWATANAGQTVNHDAITAAVSAGTSLFGGRGIFLGSLLGAVIVSMFHNGLTLMGLPSVYQALNTGILVILVVTTDQLSRKGAR